MRRIAHELVSAQNAIEIGADRSELHVDHIINAQMFRASDGAFENLMQKAELDHVATSQAMQTVIAENYVGLPL